MAQGRAMLLEQVLSNLVVAHNIGLIFRPNEEIARIHATRVRTAPTKIPLQVGALLHGSIKVERCLTGG